MNPQVRHYFPVKIDLLAIYFLPLIQKSCGVVDLVTCGEIGEFKWLVSNLGKPVMWTDCLDMIRKCLEISVNPETLNDYEIDCNFNRFFSKMKARKVSVDKAI